MSKQMLVFAICSVIVSLAVLSTASPGLSLFGRKTTTTTTTTIEPPTTKSSPSLWLENRIPKISDGCTGVYACKKKVKHGTETGRVCLKYCLTSVECPANVVGAPATIDPDWCVHLNPDTLDDIAPSTGPHRVKQVNMIDFPCQPGYLPDSRGRCREVW